MKSNNKLLVLSVSLILGMSLVACNTTKTTNDNSSTGPQSSESQMTSEHSETSNSGESTSNNDSSKANTSSEDDSSSSISSSEQSVEMTASYIKAREEFYIVTGILLPAVEGVEVCDYPYHEGDKSYCFDIEPGENVNFALFETYKAFLDVELEEWIVTGPQNDGEYVTYNYTSTLNDWIGITWDGDNNTIYINTLMA